MLVFLLLAGVPAAYAFDVERPDIRNFIDQMVAESDYDRETLTWLFRELKRGER